MVTETRQLYSFLINNVEVVSVVVEGTKINRTRKTVAGDTALIKLDLGVEELVTVAAGQSVVVSRGDASATEEYIFRGIIKTITQKNSVLEVECVNNLYQLKYDIFTKSYDKNVDTEAGVISAIAEDIITNGGLTASTVSSGTDLTVEKFISNKKDRLNRLEILGKIVNYILIEDYDNDWIRFEPEGSNTYATTLTAGGGGSGVNVYNLPVYSEDLSQMRNKVFVDGAFEEDTTTETFNGDASTATFTLQFTPETVNLSVGGTEQVLGVPESTQSFDYTLDKDLKTFTFESGSIPGVGTGNIVMTYTYKIPYTSVGRNESSIAEYGVVQAEAYNFDDIINVQDADNRVVALLDKLAFAKVTTDLITDARRIRPGMTVNLVDNYSPERSGAFIVQSITTNYPQPMDTVKVGDTDFDVSDILSSISARLNAIEGVSDSTNEILRQLFDLVFSIKFRSWYFKKQHFDITTDPDTLYWDTETQGTWGNDAGTNGFEWGDDTEETFTDDVILQGNNTYYEICNEDDFHDSVNSTATFDTSNKQIIFTSGQVWYTEKIALGSSYVAFNMRKGSQTGTLSFEVSFDNRANWQTVSSFNVRTLVANGGSNGVYIRITETGGGAATLQPVYNTTNEVSDAAVTLFMEE